MRPMMQRFQPTSLNSSSDSKCGGLDRTVDPPFVQASVFRTAHFVLLTKVVFENVAR
jgi:hypothetical protein